MPSDLETKLAECAEAAGKLPPGPWEAANTLSAKWPVVRMPRGHATYTPSVYLQRTANGLEASANGDRIGATNVAAFIVAARNLPWPTLLAAWRLAEAYDALCKAIIDTYKQEDEADDYEHEASYADAEIRKGQAQKALLAFRAAKQQESA